MDFENVLLADAWAESENAEFSGSTLPTIING